MKGERGSVQCEAKVKLFEYSQAWKERTVFLKGWLVEQKEAIETLLKHL